MKSGIQRERFGWEELTETAPPGDCVLQYALLTTYEHPDEQLLVEHLLPEWLRISRSSESVGRERELFLVDLLSRLRRLRGRLVVVASSRSNIDLMTKPNRWVWGYLRYRTVGARGPCTQHAKLWLLHWSSNNSSSEYLEVVVSSANLTQAAFKRQIQSAWRAVVPLSKRTSRARLRSWGVLQDFIKELAKACDDTRLEAEARDLLARAMCPAGVKFVASVPGVHDVKTHWGIRGLRVAGIRKRGRHRVSAIVPSVGTWSTTSLEQFLSVLGAKPGDLTIWWIAEDHPWAQGESRWAMPRRSRDVLAKAGVQFRLVPAAAGDRHGFFHPSYRGEDPRWVHAKLYEFRRGRRRKLLLTSANFSVSAWGQRQANNRVKIENFELGVLLDGIDWPLPTTEKFLKVSMLAVVEEDPIVHPPSIWADANWNGNYVDITCRLPVDVSASAVIISSTRHRKLARLPHRGATRQVRLRWADQSNPPAILELRAVQQIFQVPVFDTRVGDHSAECPIPEVDAKTYQELADQLLFEQYEGQLADDLGKPPDGNGRNGESRPGENYEVDFFSFARQQFHIVDTWTKRLGNASSEERNAILQDGQNLVGAFRRSTQSFGRKRSARKIGAQLAAEELAARLRIEGRNATR